MCVKMKRCNSCKKFNDDNAVRCIKCGAFFTGAANTPENSNGNNSNVRKNSYGKSTNYGNYNSFGGNSYNNANGNGGNGYNNPNKNSYENVNFYNNGSKYENNRFYSDKPDNKPTTGNNTVTVKKEGFSLNIIKIFITIVLAVAVLAGGVSIYRSSGYLDAISSFETNYDKYDVEKIVDRYSGVLFQITSSDEELSNMTVEKLEKIYKYYDNEIGSKNYYIKFKTIENYRMSDDEYSDFMNSISCDKKDDIIKDARVAVIRTTAYLDEKSASKNIKIILTLEENDIWRIFDFDEE